jgi:hypothetical protein
MTYFLLRHKEICDKKKDASARLHLFEKVPDSEFRNIRNDFEGHIELAALPLGPFDRTRPPFLSLFSLIAFGDR